MRSMPPTWDEVATWRDELALAASFLTRLPIQPAVEPAPGALARASWAFPLVGALVGIGGGLVYALAIALSVPPLAAALLAVAATVLLTGGLHEDGLADTADGFGGGVERDDKLAIMRDSRNGTYGVLALILSVGLRGAALAAIGGGGAVLAAMVAAHALARGALPLVQHRLDPARRDGLGAGAGRPGSAAAGWAIGLGAVIPFLALGLRPGLAALLFGGAAMALVAALARRQIGGYTGDVLGAIEQGGETVIMLVAAAWTA